MDWSSLRTLICSSSSSSALRSSTKERPQKEFLFGLAPNRRTAGSFASYSTQPPQNHPHLMIQSWSWPQRRILPHSDCIHRNPPSCQSCTSIRPRGETSASPAAAEACTCDRSLPRLLLLDGCGPEVGPEKEW